MPSPREQLVSDFKRAIRIASICFGNDITRFYQWAGEQPWQVVSALEEAALAADTIAFVRIMNGSDFTSLEPEKEK